MGFTSATFNLVGKLDVNKVLLNNSAIVSEHLSLLALKILGGIFANVLFLLTLIYLSLVG